MHLIAATAAQGIRPAEVAMTATAATAKAITFKRKLVSKLIYSVASFFKRSSRLFCITDHFGLTILFKDLQGQSS